MSKPAIARLVRNWYLGKNSDVITNTDLISASDGVKVNENLDALCSFLKNNIVCHDSGICTYDGAFVYTSS